MKKIFYFLLAALWATSYTCNAQITIFGKELFGGETIKASANYVTKKINTEDFKKLHVSGSINVTYKQTTGKPNVEVYTSDNIVDLLDIYVADGTLNIHFKKKVKASYNKLEIRVSSEQLNSISITGSGDVEILNKLESNMLNLAVVGSGTIQGGHITSHSNIKCNISGSGELRLESLSCPTLITSIAGSGDLSIDNIETQYAEASISGSGSLNLQGKTNKAKYKITGSGELYASKLHAEEVTANIAGSGEIECYAEKLLNTGIAGSGEIGYKGNPTINNTAKKGLYKL